MIDGGATANNQTVDAGWRLYTEDWDPAYGNPATFEIDAPGDAEQAEPGAGPVTPVPGAAVPLAFVDGRRRVELSVWAEHPDTGARVPGLAGAYAVGAVTIRPNGAATYAGVRIGRLAIWGGGRTGNIASRAGHTWISDSVTATEPDELLAHLQNRMRQAEGALALDAAEAGWNVVLDGPLNRILSPGALVAGYIKTHLRQILPPDDHALVPRLEIGSRTRLFALGTDRYTCYTRVGRPGPGGSPWTGIARLEFPSVAGLDQVVEGASRLAVTLPRYAGVPHRDPRAPVNLTPVKNLENHLSRCMGRVEFATRSAREAVIAGGPR
jgi:uncharacterized protein